MAVKVPSSAHYSENRAKYPCRGESYPCAVCGKPVNNPKHYLHIEGCWALEPGEAVKDESADLGLQPVGTDCLRRHPELRPCTIPA